MKNSINILYKNDHDVRDCFLILILLDCQVHADSQDEIPAACVHAYPLSHRPLPAIFNASCAELQQPGVGVGE